MEPVDIEDVVDSFRSWLNIRTTPKPWTAEQEQEIFNYHEDLKAMVTIYIYEETGEWI